MSERTPAPTHAQNLAAWGTGLEIAACEHCQQRFLLPSGRLVLVCPNCCGGPLTLLPGEAADRVSTAPPELALPHAVTGKTLHQSIQNFCADVPFVPDGLKPSALTARLTKMYLPVWLVDANVNALWQAEAGFDYQVISHQEIYVDKVQRWVSKEIKEPRVRWEERVGRLKRAYQNIPVPAVEDAARLEQQIGPFHQEDARTYCPEDLEAGIVRLPEISPKDTWQEAVAALQKTAAAECRLACGANRLREFRWKAQFVHQNWTLMLAPVYTTSYQDDDGKVHTVRIHGQTGKISGRRRASTKRALRESLLLFGAGLFILLVGLLMAFAFPNLHRIATAASSYVILVGFVTVLASGAPVMLAWDFNRKQDLADR